MPMKMEHNKQQHQDHTHHIKYACEASGLKYKEKLWAKKYQDYYTQYRACSLDIISHAVGATE
jgi:hypothetical protein